MADDTRGLVCRHCGCRHFRVVYVRPQSGGRIMRRRECRHCQARLTTVEMTLGAVFSARMSTGGTTAEKTSIQSDHQGYNGG